VIGGLFVRTVGRDGDDEGVMFHGKLLDYPAGSTTGNSSASNDNP
jgi:hypothetical protein